MIDPEFPWSAKLVVDAVRNPNSLVNLSFAPYFPELFEDDLESRVEHPGDISIDPGKIAAPCCIPVGANTYFVPGNTSDLLTYTSLVLACLPSIGRAWETAGQNEDCGPPRPAELQRGHFSEKPWKQYWLAFETRIRNIAADGYDWILYADVAGCAGNINAKLLTDLLSEIGVDRKITSALESYHEVWQHHGCKGLPVLSTFGILNRVYFLGIEENLREQDVVFLRVVDDFRVFCRSGQEREQAQQKLEFALAERGLRLNSSKMMFCRIGSFYESLHQRRLALISKFKYGALRPLIMRSLAWATLQPIAFSLISWINPVSE